uniref:Uncharacterized protein n=1 Tax=Phlebotomus papatasi TaxID=29031 RepID=A0A1B0DM64_PHLPP
MKFLLSIFVISVGIFGPWDTVQGLICHTNTNLLNDPSKIGDQGDHVRNCTEFMVPRDELACIKLDYAERNFNESTVIKACSFRGACGMMRSLVEHTKIGTIKMCFICRENLCNS